MPTQILIKTKNANSNKKNNNLLKFELAHSNKNPTQFHLTHLQMESKKISNSLLTLRSLFLSFSSSDFTFILMAKSPHRIFRSTTSSIQTQPTSSVDLESMECGLALASTVGSGLSAYHFPLLIRFRCFSLNK